MNSRKLATYCWLSVVQLGAALCSKTQGMLLSGVFYTKSADAVFFLVVKISLSLTDD